MVVKDETTESNKITHNIDKFNLIKFDLNSKYVHNTKPSNLNKLVSYSESLLLNDLLNRKNKNSSNLANEPSLSQQPSQKFTSLSNSRNSTSSLKDEYLISNIGCNKNRITSSISINTLNDKSEEDEEEEEYEEEIVSSSFSTSSESTHHSPKSNTKKRSVLKVSLSTSSSENSSSKNDSTNSSDKINDTKQLSLSSCISTSSFEPSSPSISSTNNTNILINNNKNENFSISQEEFDINIDKINRKKIDNYDEDYQDVSKQNNRFSDITVITKQFDDQIIIIEDEEDDETRRETITTDQVNKSLKEFQSKNKLAENNMKTSASESQITLTSIVSNSENSNKLNLANQGANSHNLACEVASLSSLTSTYSQFDFSNLNSTANNNSLNRAQNFPTSISCNQILSTNDQKSTTTTSSSITSFFFSNSIFGNKKQKEIASSDKTTVELKSTTPVSDIQKSISNTNQATPTKRFDLASKLFGLKPTSLTGNFSLNKSTQNASKSSFKFTEKLSTDSNKNLSDTENKTSESSSSSSSSDNGANNNSNNIRTNHSYNNLVASDFQLPSSVLIFENRPSNLPAKSQQEALKHKQEYEKMIEIAKKKEKKEKELQLKKHEQQIKKEDFMTNSLKIWNTEILTNWNELKNAKRTRSLWWHGLPPPIRGKVWKLAIGNEANLTKESYYFYEKKAKEKLELLTKNQGAGCDGCNLNLNESSVEMIKLDVSRTFPHLCFFQKDGPYHEALFSVLGAYACYNTKIGYVQGMSFLTAILLLNMEAPDAFICLANLLNIKYLLACFCMDQTKMNRYFRVHQILLQHNIPKLYEHFEDQKVKPDLYLIEWIFTLFSKSLPLDVMSRVWDVFFRDKEEFLFKTSLGILNLYKDTLLQLDFIHVVQFLTKLPENINATQLFKSIEQIQTNIDDVYFTFDHLCNEIINDQPTLNAASSSLS